ncbi:MAG: hypothetical protein ACI9D0_000925 [Bacteroidia bacterium]|jgi:hypothetical protein
MKDGERRVDLEREGRRPMEGASRKSLREKSEVSPLRFSLERLTTEELIQMLRIDSSTYSEESLRWAKDILAHRGVTEVDEPASDVEREIYLIKNQERLQASRLPRTKILSKVFKTLSWMIAVAFLSKMALRLLGN